MMNGGKISRLYQNGHELYGDSCDITAADDDDRIAGSAGWVDTYIVVRNGHIIARVPAWMVITEFRES